MPRETINIENFNKGIISKVDSGDIPNESCPYCKNINPLFSDGQLRAIKQATTLTGYPANAAKLSAFIDEDATQKTLLFHDGTKLRALEDFHGTPAVFASPVTMSGYSITPYNNFANIGNGDADPKWAGYYNNLQFNGLVTKPNINRGRIDLVTFATGGSGYSSGAGVYYMDIVQSGGSGGKVLARVTAGGAVDLIMGSVVSGYNYADGSATLSGGGGTNATVTLLVIKSGIRSGDIIVDNTKTIYTGAGTIISVQISDPTDNPTTITTSTGSSSGFVTIGDTVGTPFSSVIDGVSKVYLSDFYCETRDEEERTSYYNLDGEYLVTAHTANAVTLSLQWFSLGAHEYITFQSVPYYKLITYRNQFAYKQTAGSYTTPQDIFKDREYTLATADVTKLVIKFTSDHGYINNDVYEITILSALTPTLLIDNAALSNYKNDATVKVGVHAAFDLSSVPNADAAFSEGRKYYYGWTFIYDNTQESPIGWTEETTLEGKNANKARITITLENHASLSKRITGINIWRADSSAVSKIPESQFRLVKDLSLNNGGWNYISATINNLSIEDTGDLQASYEAITGIPQTLDDTMVRYTYATIVNGKMFYAKCYTDYWDDSLRLIFASKPNQFNTIDISTDVARVKFIPTAIANYNGKLLVFGENEYAIINPEGMYIEYETKGIGCYSHKSVYTTDWGLYWMDNRGAYYYSGANTEVISDAISDKVSSDLKSWTDILGIGQEYQVIYYHTMRSILFINMYTGVTWCYYLPSKAWFYWELGAVLTTRSGVFLDKTNVLYLSAEPTLDNAVWFTLFTASTYSAWEWYSKKFNGNDPGQYKKWYEAKCDGNATITYGIEDGALTSTLTSDIISSGSWKARRIQFKLTGASGSTFYYANNLAIIFRPLVGKR